MRNRTRAIVASVFVVLATGGVAAPATAATYTRTMHCNSTGLLNYDVTGIATWQTNSAGQRDLVSLSTSQHLGQNTQDWANSMTASHRISGTNKQWFTVDPTSGQQFSFPGLYWASPTASEVYLAASNNTRGIKCGPMIKTAV